MSSPKAPPASVTRKGSSVGPLPFLMLQARFCRNGPFEPPFLHLEAAVITPKVRLGADYVPDFVIELRRRRYIFVEVEHPQHQVITRNGRPSAKLTAANQQVEDWFRWTSDNIAYARTILPDISEPSGKVILGRDAGIPPQHREVLRRRNAEYHRIESMTFDDLLENAEQHLSNLRHM